MNSELKDKLGEATAALVINYLVSISCVVAYMLLTRQSVPGAQYIGQVPWWGWLGGLLGAASGIIAVIVAKQLGAGALAAFAVAGQLIASVVLDHFGWLGFELHAANWPRAAGCGLMIAGLALMSRF